MREITTHVVKTEEDNLRIDVMDDPGAGGAHHCYRISNFDTGTNEATKDYYESIEILFQNGTLAEKGANGLTHETLLAIVADRLESFQAGPFACDENADALDHCKRALAALKKRTKDRQARGVEGKHEK